MAETKTNDILNRKYDLKRFMKLIFEDIDFSKEAIGILFVKKEEEKEDKKVLYKFRNFDTLVDTILDSKMLKTFNCYFYTCSFDITKDSFKDDAIAYRYAIGLDFDRKDYSSLNMKEAIDKFKKSRLSYHAIVDSGNGYHIYSCIKKTNDWQLLKEVNQQLKELTSCDALALHTNQILRVPTTFNTKKFNKTGDWNDRKYVNLLVIQNRNDKKFKRYDLEEIEEWLIDTTNKNSSFERGEYFVSGKRGEPYCLREALTTGTKEGNRNKDMLNFVAYLRDKGLSKEEIHDNLIEWATKSDYVEQFERKLDYAFEKWDYFFKCKDCPNKSKCNFLLKSKQIGIWEFDKNYNLNEIDLSTWIKGVKEMTGNELLIVTILYNYRNNFVNGMSRNDIIKELTYKKKCRLSKPTLTTALSGLVEKGYIECKELKSGYIYKLTTKLIKERDDNINISYMASCMCICNNISTEELRFYYFLRLLHEKRERKGIETYCQSFICIPHEELAKEYKKWNGRSNDRSSITRMMNSLVDCKMIKIIDKKESERNGYTYNIYKLNS